MRSFRLVQLTYFLMALAVAPMTVQAQRGPWISVGPGAMALQPVTTDGALGRRDAGISQEARVGWRGDSTISAFVRVAQSDLPTSEAAIAGTARYREVEVGARFQWPTHAWGRVSPLLDIGLAQRTYRAKLSQSGEQSFGASAMQMSGLGASVALGLQAALMPGIAIDMTAGLMVGQFSDLRFDASKKSMTPIDAGAGRAHFGLVIAPGAWIRPR